CGGGVSNDVSSVSASSVGIASGDEAGSGSVASMSASTGRPANGSSASASVRTSGTHAAGSFAMQRMTTAASAAGTSDRTCSSGSGSSYKIRSDTPATVVPWNGMRPARSWNIVTPSDHTSARASTY